ncbi:MAG: CRISPR-associated endonuclease Cas2 [Nitrososphaerota archaeon]
MYVIITYDVEVERINNVRKILRQYLNWVQNSVFEGEISEGKLEELKRRISEEIDIKKDSVLIYKFSNPKWIAKDVWGIEKNPVEEVI